MSKLRCWVGCLARVVTSGHPENIGVIVRVESAYTDAYYRNEGPAWWVVAERGAPASNHGRPVRPGERAHCADRMLVPLTPPLGTVIDAEVRELPAPKQTEAA